MKQNTQEWLESRKSYIGASEASILFDCNPWKNKYQLWQEKTGKKEPSSFVSPAMQNGSDKEKEALEKYNEITSSNCVDTIFIDSDRKFLRASLDGYDKEKLCGVEIKCPQFKSFENLKKEIPKYYILQMQQQMLCSGLKKIDFFVYLDSENFKLQTVNFDPDLCQELKEKVDSFWKDVIDSNPPKKIKGEFIEMDKKFESLCLLYRDLQEESKKLQEKQDQVKVDLDFFLEEIIEMAGEKNSFYGDCYLKKFERKGTIDYKSIPEIQKVDLEKHRKCTSHYWRIQYTG